MQEEIQSSSNAAAATQALDHSRIAAEPHAKYRTTHSKFRREDGIDQQEGLLCGEET